MPEKFYFYRREEPLRKFPTAGALLQHNERVSYQGYHRWGQCLVSNPELPSPSEWDGQNPSQMHGILGGLHYLKHQKNAWSL